MTYIEERRYRKKRGVGIKYYLCDTLRTGARTRKVSVYLGTGPLSPEALLRLQKEKAPLLKQKSRGVRGSTALPEPDHLNGLLSTQSRKALEQVRAHYTEDLRLLTDDEKRAIESDFLTDYAYQTTKIEGSTLTARDAERVLRHGQVPSSRDLRDVYGLRNIITAWDYISGYAGGFTEQFVRRIHGLVMANILESAGRYREIQVYMGRGQLASKHVPPPPDEVSQEMRRFAKWVRNHENKVHPVVLACFAHHLFIAIHPFIDGNGRTGRLLLHFLLHKHGYPPLNILNREKMTYVGCLEKARDSDMKPFVDFIVRHLLTYKSPLAEKARRKRAGTS